MAWTEQCKMAFKMNADHQVWTQKGQKNITKVLKKLSKESDIPFKTLNRWYYEKEEDKKKRLNNLKNEVVSEHPKNIKEKEKGPSCPSRKVCIKCETNLVEIDNRSGKEKGPNNKYYGLCGSCRKKAKVINDAIAIATKEGDGEWVICPECNHHFTTFKKGETK